MNIKDNGLFKFDYQFPVYNFFFPNKGKSLLSESLSDVLSHSNSRISSRALYFHISFCETICTFCPFTRGAYKDSEFVGQYTRALIREIEIKAEFNDYHALPVRSIFFGGGTPSLLSPENIAQIRQVQLYVNTFLFRLIVGFRLKLKSRA